MKQLPPTLNDTIVALSTPAGYSGIGVIRLSGPDALPFLERIFVTAESDAEFPDRKAVYGKIVDPDRGQVIDDGIVTVMRGPRSYTGEDVAELSLHGSPVLLDLVIRLLLDRGARLAGRGEFTRRAFLAGKLDLIQAEAVIDIIESSNESAAQEARGRMDRSLSTEVRGLSNALKDLLAEIEAHIDFDEDDDESPPDVHAALRGIQERIEILQTTAAAGKASRKGIKTVIAGKPNVGKSTLFNALLRSDRMIVTPHPGTTRDPVDERLVLDGMSFLLSDTAGIREDPDLVEEEGIRRTRTRMQDAAVIVAVLDGSEPLGEEDLNLLEECRGQTIVVVLNKTDLGTIVDAKDHRLSDTSGPALRISAQTGDGLADLEEALIRIGRDLTLPAAGGGLNERCLLLVESVAKTVSSLTGSLGRGEGTGSDVLSLELRTALGFLEELTGERVDDGILDRIFERFCVGK